MQKLLIYLNAKNAMFFAKCAKLLSCFLIQKIDWGCIYWHADAINLFKRKERYVFRKVCKVVVLFFDTENRLGLCILVCGCYLFKRKERYVFRKVSKVVVLFFDTENRLALYLLACRSY